MRQMRYAGDCGIVVGNFDRDSFSAGELDELGDIGKNLDPELARVFVFYGVVKSNSPRGLLKQSGVRVVPPGIRGTSHRVGTNIVRSEEHTSELQSRGHLVCRLLLEKKNKSKTKD